MPPDTCPNCGAPVPTGSKACPECGSDEETGWSDAAHADNLGIPDENFDYEEFVKREFDQEGSVPRGVHWAWWLVAVVLILVFIAFWFRWG